MIAAFARALPHTSPAISWEALYGGRTNVAWRGICCDRPDVVLKLYRGAAQNPLFPNDPLAEARLLDLLEDLNLTPKACGSFETEDGHCNVYEHIPGETWHSDTGAVAHLMHTLHQIAPPAGLRKIADGSDELCTQIEEILHRCLQTPDALRRLPTQRISRSGKTVLLHSDIVPGNLIKNDSGLHLIDWQCPAAGDPCEDIAVFLSPAMQMLYRKKPLSLAETETFLARYADRESAERYRALAPFYHARMAAYCQWQSENGQPDYATGVTLECEALQRSLSL
ncbi:phosphotransferase [Shimia sp. R10_1]|uniref:phosphotransferase n=1 Tax=Shimia sp. R10_1 TaxID=2821095 RepID=UPI0032AFA437